MNDESTLLSTIEVIHSPCGREPDASVIWMHGLGADAHDFESIIPMLGLAPDASIRFVFPNAPMIPVTLNMGMTMRAWYDINAADWLERRDDLEGIRRSAQQITQLIENEVSRGIAEDRIGLAGFSQGGAMALHVALRHKNTLAFAMVLSGYLVDADSLHDEASAANKMIPIFMAHGRLDPMVEIDRARRMRERLHECGYPLEWHDYPMEHQVCPEECQAMGEWMNRVLAP